MRTRSLSSRAASATQISGVVKEIAFASINGSRASAPKLKNMATIANAPRPA